MDNGIRDRSAMTSILTPYNVKLVATTVPERNLRRVLAFYQLGYGYQPTESDFYKVLPVKSRAVNAKVVNALKTYLSRYYCDTVKLYRVSMLQLRAGIDSVCRQENTRCTEEYTSEVLNAWFGALKSHCVCKLPENTYVFWFS